MCGYELALSVWVKRSIKTINVKISQLNLHCGTLFSSFVQWELSHKHCWHILTSYTCSYCSCYWLISFHYCSSEHFYLSGASENLLGLCFSIISSACYCFSSGKPVITGWHMLLLIKCHCSEVIYLYVNHLFLMSYVDIWKSSEKQNAGMYFQNKFDHCF